MMTNKNVFLDTNVVLDFLDQKRENHGIAHKMMSRIVLNDYKVVISEDMLSTIFYIDKNSRKVLSFFKTIVKKWQVVSFGEKVILSSIGIALNEKADFEDVLQCLCAKENDCSILITNDKNFYDCGVSVYTMKQFLEK